MQAPRVSDAFLTRLDVKGPVVPKWHYRPFLALPRALYVDSGSIASSSAAVAAEQIILQHARQRKSWRQSEQNVTISVCGNSKNSLQLEQGTRSARLVRIRHGTPSRGQSRGPRPGAPDSVADDQLRV
jgi:hypothetical protein